MKRIGIIAMVLVLALLLIPSVIPSAVGAASGIEIHPITGNGTWTGNTWEVDIYPGDVKSTTISLYNSYGGSLDVEASVLPDSLCGGNLTFELDKTNFTIPGRSYDYVTLTVTANSSATPGSYTAELIIKSEVPPTPTPAPLGGGGGGGPPAPELDVDLWGDVSSWDMNYNGALQEDVDAASTDEQVTVHIPKGTKVLGPDGEPLDKIIVTPVDLPPTPPEGSHVIAAFDFEPDGATFDPGIEITLAYDPDALPEGVNEANLVIAFFNEATGEWEFVTGVVDTDANTITFSVDHFTVFAIIGRENAAFEFANLSVSPNMVGPEENVTITVEVTNTGGLQGSCIVTLLIGGSEEETKEVTLEPGVSDILTFTVTRDIARTYTVEIGGLTDEFAVAGMGPGAWAGIGVLGLLLLVILGLIIWVLTRRRAQRATR